MRIHFLPANVGSVDRGIRTIIGLFLIALPFVVEGPLRWLGLIGVVLLLTAFFEFCPTYSVLGMSTQDKDLDKADQEQPSPTTHKH